MQGSVRVGQAARSGSFGVNLERWAVLTPTSTVCGNTYHRGERVSRAHSCRAGTSIVWAECEYRLSSDLTRLKPAIPSGKPEAAPVHIGITTKGKPQPGQM